MKNLMLLILIFNNALYAQTVETIIAKHLVAMGGEEKIRAIKTIVFDAQEVYSKTTYIKVGEAIKTVLKVLDTIDIVTAYDGQKAWFIQPEGFGGDYANGQMTIMKEDEKKIILDAIDPFPFLDYTNKGSFVELIGTEKVKDQNAYHISMITANDNTLNFWIDIQTHLIIKTRVAKKSRWAQEEIYYTDYIHSDFRIVEGIYFPFLSTQQCDNCFVEKTNKILINTPIDDNLFRIHKK